VDNVGKQSMMANLIQVLNTCFLHNFDKVLENVPIKHIGQPEDIASIVSYLASKEAHFISGQFMPSLRLSLVHVAMSLGQCVGQLLVAYSWSDFTPRFLSMGGLVWPEFVNSYVLTPRRCYGVMTISNRGLLRWTGQWWC
jgi:hypothetical protein